MIQRVMSTIALDAMGGDHGVAEAVRAAAHLSVKQEMGIISLAMSHRLCLPWRRTRYDAGYLTVRHASHGYGWTSPQKALRSNQMHRFKGAQLVADGTPTHCECGQHWGVHPAPNTSNHPRHPSTALAAVFPTERRQGEQDTHSL